MKDYYQILDVPPNATKEKIKEQYRFLAHAWHPDKFPNPVQKIKAEEKLKEINVGFGILSDDIKRADYDRKMGYSHTRDDYTQVSKTKKEVKVDNRNTEEEKRKEQQQQNKENIDIAWCLREKEKLGAKWRGLNSEGAVRFNDGSLRSLYKTPIGFTPDLVDLQIKNVIEINSKSVTYNDFRRNFINDIALEINNNQVDEGELFVTLNKDDNENWSLPTTIKLGDWRDLSEKSKLQGTSELFPLFTLSGIVSGNLLREKLYYPVYEGQTREFFIWKIDERTYGLKGVLVKKARLLFQMDKWTDFTAATFACDCIEKSFVIVKEYGNNIPNIFYDALKFARAWTSYNHSGNDSELRLLSHKTTPEKINNFRLQLQEKVKKESPGLGAGIMVSKAIQACLSFIADPDYKFVNQVAEYSNMEAASCGMFALNEKGFNLGFVFATKEDKLLLNRIRYAIQKKELDWQVMHLKRLLA